MFKFIFFISFIIFNLCSFVDPATVDVYTGDITFLGSDYSVSDLSGPIDYYLTDYDDIALDSSGYLYNIGNSTIYGGAHINGIDYQIRLNSMSGLQIQQTYISNNLTRSTWVDYDLLPDEMPSSGGSANDLLIIIAFLLLPIIAVLWSNRL